MVFGMAYGWSGRIDQWYRWAGYLGSAILTAALVLLPTTAKSNHNAMNCNTIIGTSSGDSLDGTGDCDDIFGRGGGDSIQGFSGGDDLHGEESGGSPGDYVFGGPHNDHVYGGPGQDQLAGRDGDDWVLDRVDGGDQDAVCGDAGWDTIDVKDSDNLDVIWATTTFDSVSRDTNPDDAWTHTSGCGF